MLSIDEIIRKREEALERSIFTDKTEDLAHFYELCGKIKQSFFADWENRSSLGVNLEIQKRAIIGYEKEKEFFKNRIRELVRELDESAVVPPWYSDLVDGIYQENWGLAGLSEWFNSRYSDSSSAKIVGENIFFMENGVMTRKPQTISSARRDQLIKAFLLLTPEERMDKPYYETYLLDGTRVTIFTEPMAKKNQAAIIFRRYIIPKLTFEEQASRGTIPKEAIPLFKAMVDIGFNVVFTGAVRTAKTTFLSTWQALENPSLEGVQIETDPEIPLHKLLPGSPVLQLIADGDSLSNISKNLLRSDADYFILAEARDGIALDTAVRVASKGTKRMKMTFHSRDPMHFPLEAASEIVKSTGGDIYLTMKRVALSFDYIFHFASPADKSRKLLSGIYQMNVDALGEIEILPICKYDFAEGKWNFFDVIGESQRNYGCESNLERFRDMEVMLHELSQNDDLRS